MNRGHPVSMTKRWAELSRPVARGASSTFSPMTVRGMAKKRTRPQSLPFWFALIFSLTGHFVAGLVLFSFPHGEGAVGLRVYQVRIIQAPPRPRASRAPVSKETPARLEVNAPRFEPLATGSLVSPELELSDTVAPDMDLDTGDPLPEPDGAVQHLPLEADPPRAPELPVDQRSESERRETLGTLRPPRPPDIEPPPGPPALTALPLPVDTAPKPPPLPAEFDPDEAIARLTPPSLQGSEPPALLEEGEASPEEKLRRRLIERIERAEETTPPLAPPRLPSVAPQPSGGEEGAPFNDPLAALALRRYRSHIRKRVQDNYNYPADFPCGVVAVVRLSISAQGEVLEYKLLEPSGNGRFDYAVELSIRRTILDPPDLDIGGGAIQPRLRFKSKQCPPENPERR